MEIENDKFLIDGFPRNEENRAAFQSVTGIVPEFVLFFDCSEEEMEKRLLSRNQDCAVGLLLALLPILGGTSGIFEGMLSMTKTLVTLVTFLVVLLVFSLTCIPWFFNLMISLSSQCSDKLGLSLELGSFAAGVMISTTDLAQHTLEQVEPIRNFFAALFLASIGMLIHVQFLWNHIDILRAAVIPVDVIKTFVVATVVKGFGYTNKTALLVGMSLCPDRGICIYPFKPCL